MILQILIEYKKKKVLSKSRDTLINLGKYNCVTLIAQRYFISYFIYRGTHNVNYTNMNCALDVLEGRDAIQRGTLTSLRNRPM